MAIYAIGDIQGCFSQFKELLKKINFNPDKDKLWICGDLVNRGPDSLSTLLYIRSLGDAAQCVLGNHDLHLLAVYYSESKDKKADTLMPVLRSPEAESLMYWLRGQPLFHFDIELNFGMVHAGVYPDWSVSDCLRYSAEVEAVLKGERFKEFFISMYGNKPEAWEDDLTGMDRLRFITNVFTRMRFIDEQKHLCLKLKNAPEKQAAKDVFPWFEVKNKKIKHNRIVFGHWSTLESKQYDNCFALDSGCLWGGQLTALRVDKKTPKWIRLECEDS
ncbi:MAG: symmetrical bis(5'-nucleosyl)-tetraphosphatase [Gammaproteobacteria bacterium]|nr:symmetrical bis(5'-nucleosyl)-tetraphosphatase [Gammaproteobacteria bacterium]